MKRTAPQAGGPSARAARVSAAAGALHLAAGDLDREYRTLGVLGRGNFSEVNLLRHRTSGELFALKTCCKLEAPSLEHLKRESTLMARGKKARQAGSTSLYAHKAKGRHEPRWGQVASTLRAPSPM